MQSTGHKSTQMLLCERSHKAQSGLHYVKVAHSALKQSTDLWVKNKDPGLVKVLTHLIKFKLDRTSLKLYLSENKKKNVLLVMKQYIC